MQSLKQAQRIAICIFFFSISFEMWDPFNTNGNFSIARLTAIIYFITIIPQFRQFIRIDNLKKILLPIWIFFGLFTLMSLINSDESYSGFFDRSMFLNIIIFWFIINHVRKDYLILEEAMLSFAFGSVALTILFYADIGTSYVGGRLTMFEDNQNSIGLRVAVSSIIFLIFTVQSRLKLGWIRLLFLLIIPLMLNFIAETGSRVSVISFLLAFVLGITLYKSKNNWSKIVITVGGLVFLTFIVSVMMQTEILRSRLLSTANSNDLGTRDEIWKNIFPLIKENPVLGVGVTGYQQFTTEIYGGFYSPHNVILEVLCYTGIIGLAIYLYFLHNVFYIGYRSYKKNGWLLPLLLVLPSFGMLLSGHLLDVKLGWIILAYIVSTSAIKYPSLTEKTAI